MREAWATPTVLARAWRSGRGRRCGLGRHIAAIGHAFVRLKARMSRRSYRTWAVEAGLFPRLNWAATFRRSSTNWRNACSRLGSSGIRRMADG